MPTRLSASGRVSRPFSSDGSGSGSVFALRVFCAMVSASSGRLIRELSDESDFDIFLVPSRSDITRVAGPVIRGSGCGKNNPSARPWPRIESPKSWLNFWAISQNFGRHQHRIVVETNRRILAILAGLFLELRHAVEPADPRHAIEYPCQFRVSGHLALVEHDVLFRIDTRGDESW